MQKIQLIPVHHPAIFADPNYYQLLFPNPKSWLSNLNEQQSFFGLIALQDETPIGGIFGISDHLNQQFQIHAWMVHKQFRGQGFGQRLLRTLETHLAKKNTQHIYLPYREEWACSTTVQHILGKQGWTPPKASSTLYQLNLPAALPDWVNTLKPPAGLEIVPWHALLLAEQAEILTQNQDDQNPILQDAGKISAATSFGLRHQQQLIGGLISHQLRPDLLQYSTFWVEPQWQPKGYGYYLIQAALHAQQKIGVPQALVQIKHADAKLAIPLDKHLNTIIQHKSTLKLSTKTWIYANRKEQTVRGSGKAFQPPYNERTPEQVRELSA